MRLNDFHRNSFLFLVLLCTPLAFSHIPKLKEFIELEKIQLYQSSCDGSSAPLDSTPPEELSRDFCARWNPDFHGNQQECCARHVQKRVHPKSPLVKKRSRCHEMTQEQRLYTQKALQGELGDVLELIEKEKGAYGSQAQCTFNNGFLSHGRRVIPSDQNRLLINAPWKCTNFGTDAMVGLLEWLGRNVKEKYPEHPYHGVRLVIGDISAPRGGIHYNPSGKRAHASHTNGQDADIRFLTVKAGAETQPLFTRNFQASENWWLLKNVFSNPYACIKVVFLDQKHIRTLRRHAEKDPKWKDYQRFIRHSPGHSNHFHVRIGHGPGLPGCVPHPHPEWEELEQETEGDSA